MLKNVDGWLDVEAAEARDDRVDARPDVASGMPVDRIDVVQVEVDDLDAEDRRASRVGSWLVRPFWMTGYIDEQERHWSSAEAARPG